MRFARFSLAGLAAAFFGIGTAAAAPQVLMVVTPSDELPLTCTNGECTTEVAAICMQPDRANPTRGKNYHVDTANIKGAKTSRAEDAMTLVGYTNQGGEVSLPVDGTLRIQAEREHYAVTLRVDAGVLAQHQLKSLAVRVTGNVLLFPQAEEADPKPQTMADAALARSTLRQTAERILDKRADTIDGARVVRAAINALPVSRATTEAERQAARDTSYKVAVSDTARGQADAAFRACRSVSDNAMSTRYNSRYGYRACLGVMHDDLIDGVNKEYWDALKGGS